jgi:hypothetical protein
MAHYPFGSPEVADHDLDVGELTRGWDRTARLARMKSRARDRDASEALDLLDLVGWADDHRTDAAESFADAALLPGHQDHSCPIWMSGVPVDEYCLAELSSALGLSQASARARTEQALELRQRLPRLWAKIHTGTLPAWKARLVAKDTLTLSDEAADYVDRHLAPFAKDLSLTRIKNLITAAILRFDPDKAAEQEAAAGESRGVWFDLEHGGDDLVTDASRPNGTGRMEAVADTPDLLAFKDALELKAREQEILGDDSTHHVRMAKALGILADPQYAIDYTATVDLVLDEQAEQITAEASASVEVRAERASKPPRRDRRPDRRPNRCRPTFGGDRPIHVHLHTSTQTARVQASGLPHQASPISRAAVERWIHELAPGTRVKVTPVVDLNRHHAVDAYEAPDFIRALVDGRDHQCVFPFCTNRGRFDLDHTIEYVDPDDGGPPAQTSNHNLAKLCRYHHRAKTHTTWTYKRVDSIWDLDTGWPNELEPDDGFEARLTPRTSTSAADTGGPPAAYLWTSPIGFSYLVTATGTYPRD